MLCEKATRYFGGAYLENFILPGVYGLLSELVRELFVWRSYALYTF